MWLIGIDETTTDWPPPVDEFALKSVDDRLPLCRFRGVSTERLATVLANGIDVDPPDAVVYVSSFEKAWEYGGLPKLVLAIDPTHLDRTFRTLGPDPTPAEREEVSALFPTMIETVDGEQWFSRLTTDDPGLGSGYEVEYARWIPGDALAALVAAIIFCRPSDADRVAELIGPVLEGSRIKPDTAPTQ